MINTVILVFTIKNKIQKYTECNMETGQEEKSFVIW